jgi:hypothetical protein
MTMFNPLSARAPAGPARSSRAAYALGRRLGRLQGAVARLPLPKPWMVLGALVGLDWMSVLEAARVAAHRGWLYDDGGGGSTWNYTGGWVLAHGHLPQAAIGYGEALLAAPIAWFAGPNLLAGLPALMLVNGLVLAPIALLCIYGISKAIGGTLFAYGAALLWIVLPLATISYFYPNYHSDYADLALPAAVGLTGLSVYPAMVTALVAAYFGYRALSAPRGGDALLAGLAAGISVAFEPVGLFLVFAAAVAFLPRPRQLALLAAGVAPSLLAFMLWKERGLGEFPPLSFHFNFAALKGNLDGLREWGWSKRLVEWAALAGLIGLARRSLRGALLIGVWFAVALVSKSSDPGLNVGGGTLFPALVPIFPAFFLLVTSIVFLVPVYGRHRSASSPSSSWPASPAGVRRLAVALGAIAVVPLLAFSALPVLASPTAASIGGIYVPLNSFSLSAQARGAVTLRWRPQATHGSAAGYDIYRSSGVDALSCAPGGSHCSYEPTLVAIVPGSQSSYVDHPPAGRWSYRVALAAAGMGVASADSPLLLSDPAGASVG